MSAGETKEISFELADGSTQSLTATVKEIKEKVLPPLDDDLARVGERVRDVRRAAHRHRDAPPRADRGGDRDAVPRRRGRRARRRLQGRRRRAARRLPHPRAAERLRPPGRGARRLARDLPRHDRPAARAARCAAPKRGAALGRARARARRGRRPARARGGGRRRRGARARAGRGARRRRRRDARGPPRERPVRVAPRRPAAAQGARPDRRRGQAHPARAGRGPRSDLDARQGESPDRDETLDPRPAAPDQQHSEGARS